MSSLLLVHQVPNTVQYISHLNKAVTNIKVMDSDVWMTESHSFNKTDEASSVFHVWDSCHVALTCWVEGCWAGAWAPWGWGWGAGDWLGSGPPMWHRDPAESSSLEGLQAGASGEDSASCSPEEEEGRSRLTIYTWLYWYIKREPIGWLWLREEMVVNQSDGRTCRVSLGNILNPKLLHGHWCGDAL